MAGASPHFSPDYFLAREAFRRAAAERKARGATYPISQNDFRGRELTIDTAYVGPRAPDFLLVVTSGIHGVEGFAGSAIQHQILSGPLQNTLPRHCGLLLIHAVNPFGFACLRRVNENNVDLNRNFLRHPDEHVPNPLYDELFEAINPRALDEESEQESQRAMAAFVEQHGMEKLQAALTCGQYVHPSGVQFGGREEQESNRYVRQILRDHGGSAARVVWLDLHTGLGPYADYEMITQVPVESAVYRRGRSWFGEKVRSTRSGESVSAYLSGDMLDGAVTELAGETEVTALAPEFGTYEPLRVFRAMRADNWLHHHGDRESPKGREIRAEILEVFRPADPAWQRQVLANGADIFAQATAALRAPA